MKVLRSVRCLNPYSNGITSLGIWGYNLSANPAITGLNPYSNGITSLGELKKKK